MKSAFEGCVFFDVLAVLAQRGCADGTQLAARERRLEHIRGVDGAFGCACSDEGVQLVDEENDLAVRLFDVFEDGFEAVFELAAEFRSCQHRAQVERDHALVAQDLGHVTGDDAAGEAFNDGGLADAGFADEDWVVLGAAREDLDDAANLFIAADDGVELAAACQLGHVFRVLFEGLEFCFGILIGHALASANGAEALEDGVIGGSDRC